MITTSTSINVHKELRSGRITSYTLDKVSLFMVHDGVQKRFNATSITNATTDAAGLIVFSDVPLWGDGSYSFYITAENAADLDVPGVDLVRLASGYVKKITNVDTIVR